MKPQVKGEAVTIVGGRVQTTPFTLEQCRQLNPGFWAALARIQARIAREMQAEVVHDESAE